MKFNVGDELMARDDFAGDGTNSPILYKWKFYRILEVEVDSRYIKFETEYGHDDEKDHFYFTYKEKHTNEPFYIWKYFYTKEEIRKLKLDKINGN